MTKRYQGWYKTTPRPFGPSLPPLPKPGGKYKILKQPNLPEHWPVSKINFVGSFGICTFVRRQFLPPYMVIYELQVETSQGPLFWPFTEEQVELIPEQEA
jgi:hypothetical protein